MCRFQFEEQEPIPYPVFVLLVVLEMFLSPHVHSAGIGTSLDDDRAPSYADDDELHSDDDAGGAGERT